MDEYAYFDSKTGVYRFLDDVDGEDSGVEELPFISYQDFDDTVYSGTQSQPYTLSQYSISINDHDDDYMTFVDDDKDKDYKPRKLLSGSKKEPGKQLKKTNARSVDSISLYDASFFTPEKQTGTSDLDSENSSSLRQYARKPRTPRTIMKMMERHRESERVRHHSLNESLKDVCMRVPGYDPSCKETKVIQMQRIIGYECYLENTLRELCEQLAMPPELIQMNSNFITDAMKSTPMEVFYQPSNYRTNEDETFPRIGCMNDQYRASDDDDDTCRMTRVNRRKTKARNSGLPPGCREINASSIDRRVLKYRREKISSPTVDSTTTDSHLTILPLSDSQHTSTTTVSQGRQVGRGRQLFGLVNGVGTEYSWPTQRFKPIGSPQIGLSSQESGIKVETQSMPDDDAHFHDIDTLIEDGLYEESEQLKNVTPSFMREETVTTSTEDADVSFDLSSPVRQPNHVFLHSPPGKGIWHSTSKLNLSSNGDTPGCKEMQTVSPENILETKPKTFTPLLNYDDTWSNYDIDIKPEITEQFTTLSTPPNVQRESVSVRTNVGTSHINCNKQPSFTCGSFSTVTKQTDSIPNFRTESRSQVNMCSNKARMSKRPASNVNVRINIINSTKDANQTAPRTISYTFADNPYLTASKSGLVTSKSLQQLPTSTHGTMPSFTYKPRQIEAENMSPDRPTSSRGFESEQRTPSSTKNKRKRYTPFRSPLLGDVTNLEGSDEGEEVQMGEKKPRLDYKDLTPVDIPIPKPVFGLIYKNQLDNKQSTSRITVVKNINAVGSSKTKTDYRRTTWMNGFMMFCQMNRHKYNSAQPGLPVSEIQKLMGYKWRNMTAEEQAPYREKAEQCSTYLQESQNSGYHHNTATYSILPHNTDIEPNIITINSSTLTD